MSITLRATLEGHDGWVTCLATTPEAPDTLISGSRDKTLLIWKIDPTGKSYAVPQKSLTGHNHFVSDVTISRDASFAISSSWDKTLRLWDLKTGKTTRSLVGHTNDVLSVSLSPDNRQIVSASRDKTIKLWNLHAECKFNISENNHTEWISCVRYSPNPESALIVSGGWDRLVKVWGVPSCKLRTNHIGHTGYINCVSVSPDGSLCASGGKDGIVMLWDLNDGKHLYSLEAGDIVHALIFSPHWYWLCAATEGGIKIWDLQSKSVVEILRLEPKPDQPRSTKLNKLHLDPYCTSLAWGADGRTLFAGYTDHHIRVWQVNAN